MIVLDFLIFFYKFYLNINAKLNYHKIYELLINTSSPLKKYSNNNLDFYHRTERQESQTKTKIFWLDVPLSNFPS